MSRKMFQEYSGESALPEYLSLNVKHAGIWDFLSYNVEKDFPFLGGYVSVSDVHYKLAN